MFKSSCRLLTVAAVISLICATLCCNKAFGFQFSPCKAAAARPESFVRSSKAGRFSQRQWQFTPAALPESQDSPESTDKKDELKSKLEKKMAAWEATEEELRAASLGGVIPTPRIDGFDIGLWILFPLMVGTAGLLLLLPLFIDKIDIDSVGPPPTI